ncbi:MAG: hypothetical protein JWN70_613 [Planctomycetaceae bacterium]|nr:hypothetical protein [Planctomycetaceae bacterium]
MTAQGSLSAVDFRTIGATMQPALFKYKFSEQIPMDEVEGAFVLALFGTEALHGESETRLLAEHAMNISKRSCVIDATTPLGMDLNRLFVAFLNRELGEDAFAVERVADLPAGRLRTQANDQN